MAKVCMSNYDPQAYIQYERMAETVEKFRKHWDKPLTYAEKVLYGHLDNPDQEVVKQESYLYLHPDRVAMQDATALLTSSARSVVSSSPTRAARASASGSARTSTPSRA